MRVAVTCCREIIANALMGVPSIARMRSRSGRTSLDASNEHLRRYAFGIILNNPSITGLIPGAHALEIGPGDHLATGLSLLAYGAASYTALDRFQGDYGSDGARCWYRLVRERWSDHFSDWPRGLDADEFPNIPQVSMLPVSIEDSAALPQNRYDLIISQAVGEHVSDIDAFAAATFSMLKPGGHALHNVDFSCHGFFEDDPLKFLTIPEPIWHLMGSNRGLPNRRRFHEFLASIQKQPFSSVEIVGRTIAKYESLPDLGIPVDSLRTSWASFLIRK
jgi:hypothetical protein